MNKLDGLWTGWISYEQDVVFQVFTAPHYLSCIAAILVHMFILYLVSFGQSCCVVPLNNLVRLDSLVVLFLRTIWQVLYSLAVTWRIQSTEWFKMVTWRIPSTEWSRMVTWHAEYNQQNDFRWWHGEYHQQDCLKCWHGKYHQQNLSRTPGIGICGKQWTPMPFGWAYGERTLSVTKMYWAYGKRTLSVTKMCWADGKSTFSMTKMYWAHDASIHFLIDQSTLDRWCGYYHTD